MYSDLPVPGATGHSCMKVRTPRGQVQPLKVPCLSGGPSMQCCQMCIRRHLHCTRAPDGGLTDQLMMMSFIVLSETKSNVFAQCGRWAAAQVTSDTGTSAHAHTPRSRESLPSRELPPTPASLPPSEWLLMENCQCQPGTFFT